MQIDPQAGSLTAIFSTENLLLNGYRQRFWGQPIFIAADAAYRVNKEGNGVFLVATTNLAQETKTIAYAVLESEKENWQEFILETVKHEIEAIITRLQDEGITSC